MEETKLQQHDIAGRGDQRSLSKRAYSLCDGFQLLLVHSHSRPTLLFLLRYPKPFPDKSNPCIAPKLLIWWRWKKWQSWVNQLPLQPTTAMWLQQLLTHEWPGCLGMELHQLTLWDGQPHTQWRGRWSSCKESKQQWLKVLSDVWSEHWVCLCFLLWQLYLADTQETGLFKPLV